MIISIVILFVIGQKSRVEIFYSAKILLINIPAVADFNYVNNQNRVIQ